MSSSNSRVYRNAVTFEGEDYPSSAVKFTTAQLRLFPGLLKWYMHPGEDEGHDEIARQWAASESVSAELEGVSPRHHEKFLTGLLEAAKAFHEEQDARLAGTWERATAVPAFSALPVPAQRLYGALHAKGAHPGKYGGPNQLMSHLLAVDFIEALYGRRYTPPTVTAAMRHLKREEFVYVVVGQKYGDGSRPARNAVRATVYDLLPAGSHFIKPFSGEGLYKVDSRPRLPAETVERLIPARQSDPERGKAVKPLPPADPAHLALLNGDDL